MPQWTLKSFVHELSLKSSFRQEILAPSLVCLYESYKTCRVADTWLEAFMLVLYVVRVKVGKSKSKSPLREHKPISTLAAVLSLSQDHGHNMHQTLPITVPESLKPSLQPYSVFIKWPMMYDVYSSKILLQVNTRNIPPRYIWYLSTDYAAWCQRHQGSYSVKPKS